MHAPSQDIYDDSQESFCNELEQPFDQFPKHNIKFCYESSVQHYKDLITVEVAITVPSPNAGKCISSDKVSYAIN